MASLTYMSVLNYGLCARKYLAYFAFLGETAPQPCPYVWGSSEHLTITRYLWAFSVGLEGHTSQPSDILFAFRNGTFFGFSN